VGAGVGVGVGVGAGCLRASAGMGPKLATPSATKSSTTVGTLRIGVLYRTSVAAVPAYREPAIR